MEQQASWLDYIRTDQLPEDYQLLVRIIGLELTIKVAQQLPKVHLYFKSPEKLFLPAKEKYVLDRWSKNKGLDRRSLALETGLSERHVYDLIATEKEKSQPGWKQETLL
jgi:hypothetical protein